MTTTAIDARPLDSFIRAHVAHEVMSGEI